MATVPVGVVSGSRLGRLMLIVIPEERCVLLKVVDGGGLRRVILGVVWKVRRGGEKLSLDSLMFVLVMLECAAPVPGSR